jgi:predicted nuclease of predicted toxin-antitoxin system
MRFLADENFPRAAVMALEAAAREIVWLGIAAPGTNDAEVLAWAVREERILLTFDKDFGELVGRSAPPSACGVILFRLPMPKSDAIGSVLANLIMTRDDWAGHFSVIEPGRIRMRRIA